MAGSGMTAFEIETVESCCSLGIFPADLFRPSHSLRSGRHVDVAVQTAVAEPQPGLPPGAQEKRSLTPRAARRRLSARPFQAQQYAVAPIRLRMLEQPRCEEVTNEAELTNFVLTLST